MDIVLMILYCTIVLGVLVVIHEGGHYFASRAFGVRVTEFMVGLPGPSIGFTRHGTRFGITAVPLGGYARVCGMEPGQEQPHLCEVLAFVYRQGTALMEDVARGVGITDDEAYEALEELVEWGSLARPHRSDKFNTYRAPAVQGGPAEGEARPVDNPQELIASERSQQYRSLPFWKRCIILLAGPGVNLLFAIIVFVVIYSIVGFDVQNTETGEISHMTVDPGRSIMAGFNYIGMVFMAILQLFNPATAAQTVSESTSIVGIAVLSKTAAEQGVESFLMFMSMLSVSLGLMNLLPIPPLDGGRFIVEIYQKIRRRWISMKALNYVSMAGMALFVLFFVFMLNQDVQRFVLGNW